MNRISKYLSTFLAFALFLFRLSSAQAGREILSDPGAKVTIERIAGKDRYETAVLLSQATFSTADTAVIASGETWPDALMGGQLALHGKGPLLLVAKDRIPSEVFVELHRLGVTKVYLLGGDASLSGRTESQFKEHFVVSRLYGSDRYVTAREIVKEIQSISTHAQNEDPYYYVHGDRFPDALVATPYAFQKDREPRMLMLFDGSTPVPHGVTLGGTQIPGTTETVSGKDRYETAALLFGHSEVRVPDTLILAGGLDYPDGLTAAVPAVLWHAGILLTPPDRLHPTVREQIKEKEIRRIILVGGVQSIRDQVIDEIKNMQ